MARRFDTLAGRLERLDRSMADVAVHGREVAEVVAEAAPGALARLEVEIPSEPARSAATGPGDGAALQSRVLATIPADRWIEIPALHRELEAAGSRLGPGALRDILLSLAARGQVAFQPWNRTIYEVPDPDHAILRPEARVLYYVKRVERDGLD